MTNGILLKGLACASFMGVASAYADNRPNIIYIFTDQQTARAMSCAGNTDVNTPNMDRLAAAGIMFENAYCTAPLSGPSRAAMFTGHRPDEVNMLVNGAPMPDSLQTCTLGSLVKAAGYDCVYGGKWHLPLLDIPDGKFGFRQLYRHSDDGLAEACVNYLKQKHERPFFLVASFDNPHNICEFARSQNLPYGNIDTPDLRDCPGLPANFAKNPYDADVIEQERSANYKVYPSTRWTPENWRQYRYAYYRLVEKVDREIGKIIDVIDDKNLWENTVVIFSSDHGDGVGAHQWNQKSALYEEVVNVPLIVTLPGRKHAGTVMPQLVSNGVDFFATICDWTGAEHPEGMAGTSFRKLAEQANPQAFHQEYVVAETQFDGGQTRGWMVRTERYKYVLYDKGRFREQLFDMQTDRGETRNLMMERAYAEVAQRHRDLLASFMEEYRVRPSRTELHDVPGKVLKREDIPAYK